VIEGLTKVFYPEASNTGDLRDHGDRPHDPPARAFRAAVMTDHTEVITTAQDEAWEARLQRNAFLVMMAILIVAPAVVYPMFLMKGLCFALFACAFNLLIGFGGLLSFGHAMFLGMAGYIAAHSAKVWGMPTELAILTGMAASTVLGVFAGLLAIRRQGIYFAMITLALAQMVFFFCLQAPFTGGEDGIQSVPRGKLLGLVSLTDNTVMYYFVLAIFTAASSSSTHHPLALRAGAEGDSRQRAARDLARLPHRALQAGRLRAVGALAGLAGRPRRSSSSSPRSPTCTGACRARWC
jgi:branched-chain amino acid transport system permease protein